MRANCQLIRGDCLKEMPKIESGSVDMILADPPYGTMFGCCLDGYGKESLSWDVVIPLVPMLEECNRILRKNGALLLFSQEPYTSEVIINSHSNLPFSYRLIWLKDHFANSLFAKKAPVSYVEDICVFFKKYDLLNLHPLRAYAEKIMMYCGRSRSGINFDLGHRKAEHFFYIDSTQFSICTEKVYNELISFYQLDKMDGFLSFIEIKEINKRFSKKFNLPKGEKYKSNVLVYKKDYTGFHPTQKPVLLMEDLIKMYTDENDTVLDFVMGSGSTGVACKQLGRNFIGIEKDEKYFKIAHKRIGETSWQLKLF